MSDDKYILALEEFYYYLDLEQTRRRVLHSADVKLAEDDKKALEAKRVAETQKLIWLAGGNFDTL